jgi:hypothetical protein
MGNAVETLNFAKARPASTAGGDTHLLRAETRVAGLLVALARLQKGDCDIGAEHRLIDQLCATLDWIRRAKPESLIGAAVKLRALLHLDLGSACDPGDARMSLQEVLAVVEREVSAQQTCTGATRRVA